MANKSTLDAAAIRAQHGKLLLELLWEARSISRAELARRTGLSRSTVSAIVGDLLERGLIHATGAGTSSGGRRPIMLSFSDDARAVVGLDVGATHVAAVVTNLRGEIKSWRHEAHGVRDDPVGTLDIAKALIRLALTESGTERSRVLGIGVAVPSPVSREHPGRLNELILPAWKGYDVVESLTQAFDVPVFVNNDADAGALAELWWATGREVEDLVFIKMATGIGTGLILGGRVYRGYAGVAGEMGHTSIDPDGPRCICGLNGCLNVKVGGPYLLERARQTPGIGHVETLEQVIDLALAGNEAAREVFAYAGRLLGVGVANLLNLLNPKVVVLGGGITRAGEILMAPLREVVETRSLLQSISHAEITVSSLGKSSIALGAATRVIEAALEDPEMFEPKVRAAQAGAA